MNALCSYPQCRSKDIGEYTPVIRMYSSIFSTVSHLPAHVFIHELIFCRNCCDKVTAHDIMDNSRWEKTCKQFTDQGAPVPRRDTIELLFKKKKTGLQ